MIAKAGAKHVYAVEKANIHRHSRRIIEENNLQHLITVINARIEDVELPVEKVDIIICEWMGYFLLYESMLDCVLFARDKWLAPDGLMMPDRAELFMALIEDQLYYQKKVVLLSSKSELLERRLWCFDEMSQEVGA